MREHNRYIYRSHQLAEVICQLRFQKIPGDLSVFQQSVSAEFPIFSQQQNVNPAGGRSAHALPSVNYEFSSPDTRWRINLTDTFISLSCYQYENWEEFACRLDKTLVCFISVYHPDSFERIGLRYLNFISRNQLEIPAIPFRELIASCYLGPLANPDIQETAVTHCSVDTQLMLSPTCRAKIHAGPGIVRRNGIPDSEIKFIFDQDLFSFGKIPVNQSAFILQQLHIHADSVFQSAITDRLHDAMKPHKI